MKSTDDRWRLLTVDLLTEEDARRICTWRYPPPYDVYDYPDWETVNSREWDLSKADKRYSEYVAFRYLNGLVAFGRVSGANEYALIGIGLRPDFCDKGLGERVMRHLVSIAQERYPDRIPALEVRTFNKRAIRCYEKCGFRLYRHYRRTTCTGEDAFCLMVCQG